MKDEENVYQLKRALERVESGMASQAQILSDMRTVLKDMNETMKSFSAISSEQIRQKTIVENLMKDSNGFKKFIENSNCKAHEVSIDSLQRADSSKGNVAAMGIIGFITAIITGLITWMATK